jgi:hypothetical protein
MNVLQELQECRKFLDTALTVYYWGEHYAPLAELQKKLQLCEKNLAERLAPVKVAVALTDDQETGSLTLVRGVIGTVPAKVTVVDHRRYYDERVYTFQVDAVSVPAEFIEAVSDEAAEYVKQDPSLVETLSEL